MLALAPSVLADPPAVYHSRFDDGSFSGAPASIPSGAPFTLHLYLGVGTTPSTADPCFRGDGDELCGHRLRFEASGAVLEEFVPADPDLLFELKPEEIRLTGGDFEDGDLGATKIGDLVLEAPSEGGSLMLVAGEFVTSRLTTERIEEPVPVVYVPEPGVVPGLVSCLAFLGLLHRARRSRQMRAQRCESSARPRRRVSETRSP